MRIAFCGASGTGKTTLAQFLAEELGLPLNPVGSRSVAAAMGFSNPYDVDKACIEAYLSGLEHMAPSDAAEFSLECDNPEGHGGTVRTLFQKELLKQKVAWELEHDSFVTDRTSVDNFVYSSLHNVAGVDLKYIEGAERHVNRYDVVFFTHMASFHNLSDDPNRVSDLAYHHIFELFCDGTLVNWLGNDWNEKVRFVDHTPLEARKAFVLHTVKELKR